MSQLLPMPVIAVRLATKALRERGSKLNEVAVGYATRIFLELLSQGSPGLEESFAPSIKAINGISVNGILVGRLSTAPLIDDRKTTIVQGVYLAHQALTDLLFDVSPSEVGYAVGLFFESMIGYDADMETAWRPIINELNSVKDEE